MSSKVKRLGTLADVYQSQNLDGAIHSIQLTRIHPSAEQPRMNRTAAVQDLAASLKQDGLLSPILVKKEGKSYRIIAGERRFRAATLLGWKEMECRIISRKEQDCNRIALVENVQRENLSAEEESRALLLLKKQDDLSDASLAVLVGKSRNYITEVLGIASLPGDVLKQCSEIGLTQKNMLIQAVQSNRKGKLKEFLANVRNKNIQSVKSAKQFNRNQEKEGTQSPSETKAHKSISKECEITVAGKLIQIHCSSTQSAKSLSSRIQKLLLEPQS